MDQPITIKYRWSVDDLLDGYRYYFRHLCRPIVRGGLHLVFAMTGIGGVLALLHYYGILQYAGHRESSPVIPIASVVVALYWFIFRRVDFLWTVRRRYARRPDRDSEFEWQITADRICTRNHLATSEFSWEILAKVVRTPSGLMFCYCFDPLRHPNVKPLTGPLKGLFRFRAGDYRIVYQVDATKNIVYVVRIAHRKEAYE